MTPYERAVHEAMWLEFNAPVGISETTFRAMLNVALEALSKHGPVIVIDGKIALLQDVIEGLVASDYPGEVVVPAIPIEQVARELAREPDPPPPTRTTIIYTNQDGIERRVTVLIPPGGKLVEVPLAEGDTGVLSATIVPDEP